MDYLLHHRFLTAMEQAPKREVVADEHETLTAQTLARRAGFLAQTLARAGVTRRDRVAFYLDHDIFQAVLILGCSAVGAVFVPVNEALFPKQVLHILRDSEARVLVTTRTRAQRLQSVLSECRELSHIWCIEELHGEAPLPRHTTAIENDLAALMYTSGSTGQPKGVMFSHKNIVAGGDIVSDYLHLTTADRLLGVLPLSFDYGLNQLVTMLMLGGYYHFCSFRVPNDIVAVLTAHRITGLAGVPPMWALLARSTLARTSLPHLRYITNSGGAMPTHVLKLLRDALPSTQIILMYGLTEAFRSTYLPPEELERLPTSMGKAIPNTEILVVDEEGRRSPPGMVGELVHRGATVAMGYWRRPEETNDRFRPAPGLQPCDVTNERAVYSGDLVKTDEDGFLYFVGRRDSMIKCAGHRISPTEVEDIVFESGLVRAAAAVGVPDSVAGAVIWV